MIEVGVINLHDDIDVPTDIVSSIFIDLMNIVVIHNIDSDSAQQNKKKYDIVLLFFNGKHSPPRLENTGRDTKLIAFYAQKTRRAIKTHKITDDFFFFSIIDIYFDGFPDVPLSLLTTKNLLIGSYSQERSAFLYRINDSIRDYITSRLIQDYEKRLKINSIIRSIEFPPEYHQAGLNILNYFGTIIRQRYPEIPVTVRIEQEGLTVRMSVETPEGQRDIVERTLEAYGLVVTGKMAPEELLEDPYQVMALKHKLDIANMELRHARDHLQLPGQQQQARITSLEAEVTHLRQLYPITGFYRCNVSDSA